MRPIMARFCRRKRMIIMLFFCFPRMDWLQKSTCISATKFSDRKLADRDVATPGPLLTSLLLFISLLVCIPSQAQQDIQTNRYVLGAGDQIKISVYDEQDLSFDQVRLGDSGTITYPFLGEIKVNGLTTTELESAIAIGLIDGEYLIQPEVTVTIMEYRQFYIDGEVNRPGGYPFEPGLTLRKAVTLAGGFTERASRSKITIISDIQDLSSNENARITNVNVSLSTLVKPGDTITVEQRFF